MAKRVDIDLRRGINTEALRGKKKSMPTSSFQALPSETDCHRRDLPSESRYG